MLKFRPTRTLGFSLPPQKKEIRIRHCPTPKVSTFHCGFAQKSCPVRSAGMSEPSGDKLILRGLMFHGYHGAKEEEKKLGQKFLVDVDAWMDLRPAGRSDNLHDTVSYTAIYRIVKEVVEGPSRNLLESVAEQVAMNTLTKFPQISAVWVKVGKPHVAVQGYLDYLGIEIVRNRSNLVSQ